MDELDHLLDSILSGTSAVEASNQYLNNLLGIQPEQKAYLPMGQSANGAMGRGAGRDGITDPSQIQRDENGYITGRAATFATPDDIARYRATGSLATGDNGVGAYGADTTKMPGVAVPRDMIESIYGSVAAGKHGRVQVVSPNGTTAVLPILDVGPRLKNRANSALIELTGPATQVLGSGDMGGYKFKFL